ncbi:nuclear transport factor 2 family protein [Caenibius sp. WL]|uniref:nuclear transport factor 2 family protein n=1 Tax=Caenibius sp. WL TaxID=2872646 RepID=UPI001C99F340|nr:nuclear transport factor 2 family protein [Caenibius sp. WL]QZP09542.1 nuclear transport factor 2 family protein [Caenibius sp. WL]
MDIDPAQFAARWAAAWNAHDVEAVLAHFHEEAAFTSPFAAQVMPETGGVLRGKAAIRAYWTAGLARIPDLHFTVEGVFAGVDCLVIAYTNQKGTRVSEVLRFAGGKVIEGHGTYPVDVANPTGAQDG